MLVLTRKIEEAIVVGDGVEIKILEIKNGVVKLGIKAPKEVSIHRKEVFDEIERENKGALNLGNIENLGKFF